MARHFPCGHWHKTVPGASTIPEGSIYVSLTDIDKVACLYFDGSALTFKAYYIPSEDLDISGIDFTDDNRVVAVYGSGSTAQLHKINPIPAAADLNLVSIHTPFTSQYDIDTGSGVIRSNIHRDRRTNKYYTLGSNCRVITLSDLDTIEGRGHIGSVVTGTDGNLYRSTYVYFNISTGDRFHPITGGDWEGFWALIPDNLHDGPINTWGVWEYDSLSGSAVTAAITGYNGKIFTAQLSSPKSWTRIINADSFLATSSVEVGGYDVFYDEEDAKIYSAVAIYDGFTVHQLNAVTLDSIGSVAVSYGRWPKILRCGNKIIVCTGPYLSGSWLYKIDPDGMMLEDSMEIHETSDACALDSKHVLVANDSHFYVYDIETMSEVTDLNLGVGAIKNVIAIQRSS